jgi:predicted acylesterase/phospholipase RssA
MYDTLVFSGGGPAAIAFVGSVKYLEHIGSIDSVRTFVGTSAGAIMALLCAIGMTSDELRAWLLHHVGSGELASFDADGILEFSERLGIDDGTNVTGCMRETLIQRGYSADPTFLQLAKSTGKHLVVCASNLTEARHAYFSVDNEPAMSVLLAVRMSFGIPILFTPITYRGCMYVDGGMFNNCPVEYVGATRSTSNTLALDIMVAPDKSDEIKGPCDYVCLLLRTLFVRANAASQMAQPAPPSASRVTKVDVTPPHDSRGLLWQSFSFTNFAFNVSDDYINARIQHGYDSLQTALEGSIAEGLTSCPPGTHAESQSHTHAQTSTP